MFIFWKLGFKDSMSVNIFALSVTDFITTFLQTVVCLCYLTSKFYPDSNVDFWAIGNFAVQWMENAAYLISCWITAVISIERCFCVVFPFKVKQIFTRFRSFIALLTIYVLHIGLHVLVYAVHKMEWMQIFVHSPAGSNVTVPPKRRFTAVVGEETARIEEIFNIIVSLALSDVSFIIVIACTAWMIHKLHATATIRQVLSSRLPEGDSQQSQLSSKERRLVKVALALATALTACSLPRVVVVIVQSSLPQSTISSGQSGIVAPNERYVSTMWAVAYIFTIFGSSITIFVYLVLSNNYRTRFIRACNRIVRCTGYREQLLQQIS
ncbi:hypothetical protein BsWGS_12251 [Bradybaena similaris]